LDSTAYGINDNGQIVGESYKQLSNGGLPYHAFLFSGGAMIDLGGFPLSTTLGDYFSIAYAVNNNGQATGLSFTGGETYDAVLWSGGAIQDLGGFGGGAGAGYSINSRGQIVGYSFTTANGAHAFLYDAGVISDLNNLVTIPSGAYLAVAHAINDVGQIVASGSDGHLYLLTLGNLTTLNPFASYAAVGQAPQTINASTVLNSPAATSLAADGESAVVLAYQSTSSQPVTFSVSASGTGLTSGTALGSLGQFDPNYLSNPSPPGGNVQNIQVAAPTSGPDAAGHYTFLSLLWGPNSLPVANVSRVNLAVTATQQGISAEQATIALEPPPLLLVHGIWSNAGAAGFRPGSGGFNDWIASQYPHDLIYPVNYGGPPASANYSSKAFNDPRIQGILLLTMTDALAGAAAEGMVARTVDVVGHSMGGLVTRYFLSPAGSAVRAGNPALLPNPVHKLITIGTPHQGSPLATALVNNQNQTSVVLLAADPELYLWCFAFSTCTLGDVLGVIGDSVDTGAQSLAPGSSQLQALSPTNVFSAIVGTAPTLSTTEVLLNVLIGAFLPGQTVSTIMSGQPNDTIVPVSSQDPPRAADMATIPEVVHTSICGSYCLDVGEAASQAVWAQAYWWLTGGIASAPVASLTSSATSSEATAPAPILNLRGYTQVSASNVAIVPASGSTLPINSTTNITATSATKTITEVLLLQVVADPADTVLLYVTQSPFSIPFKATRLGSANFGAIAVFSDNTYAITNLSYTLQPSGTPYALNLVNTPIANMTIGVSRVINANAVFISGPTDVTQVATYTARSGTASVFGLSSGGTITATGNGVDLLVS
jgi:probable HAF family extracellular repeat protein